MKVSKSWLQELIDLNTPIKEVAKLLPLRTIGTKEITDDFIELDMRGYNRADLLSMRGVAREVAAITDSELSFDENLSLDSESFERLGVPKIKVSVEDQKLCPVYCAAKIEGLKVKPSSKEWVKKLEDSGVRSINNVADITNLIMLEFGQPMHAFDADKVADETLIVRLASQGETLQTLDNKVRNLDKLDLLITDPKKSLGIAGVMGGKESEVSDTTTSIFLETAIFDPISIRRTSQKHGLYSEASKRFQHGLTKTNLLQALSAAIKMNESFGGKLTALTTVGDLDDKPKTVQLTHKKINSLIGIDIPAKDVKEYLESLGFELQGESPWEVRVPYWRLDINLEEDLIEEVARMYGYENIPAKPLIGKQPEKIDQSLFELIYNTKKALADTGLTEVQTYSFYSNQVISNFQFPISNLVKIANPISSETEYLRTFIWPNLVEVVEKNLKLGFKDIAVFEIGKVYSHREFPKETYHLAVALMNETDNPIQELTSISRGVKLPHTGCVQSVQNGENFHPTRFTETMAEVHPRILNKFGIEKRVAILEISLETLI